MIFLLSDSCKAYIKMSVKTRANPDEKVEVMVEVSIDFMGPGAFVEMVQRDYAEGDKKRILASVGRVLSDFYCDWREESLFIRGRFRESVVRPALDSLLTAAGMDEEACASLFCSEILTDEGVQGSLEFLFRHGRWQMFVDRLESELLKLKELESLTNMYADAVDKVAALRGETEELCDVLEGTQYDLQSALNKLQVDALTGLRTRHDLALRVAEIREKDPQGKYLVMMLDIDHFKSVNDTHGHPFGDEVLKAVAQVVLDATRYTTAFRGGGAEYEKQDSTHSFRFGGEEFTVILPNEFPAERAAELAEAIRSGVEALQVKNEHGEVVPVTISVGVTYGCGADVYLAEEMEQMSSLEARGRSLISVADEALYLAKGKALGSEELDEDGRNRSCLIRPGGRYQCCREGEIVKRGQVRLRR
jgi:diguanylate cyclase (GGDEF)-like protein